MRRAVQTARRAAPAVTNDPFAADVLAGLAAKPKSLPPKYFYDLAGSALFDRITGLPEYYPTRSEIGILQDNAPAIASLFPAISCSRTPPSCAGISRIWASIRWSRISPSRSRCRP